MINERYFEIVSFVNEFFIQRGGSLIAVGNEVEFNLTTDGQLDSLDLVTLYLELEDHFEVAIVESDIAGESLHVLGKLIEYIQSKSTRSV